MKIEKQIKTIIEPTINKLDEMGISWQIERTARHFKLMYSVNGKKLTQIVSASSSDHRTSMNIKGDVMRAVKKEMDNMK
jgi:hypothetical protein